MPCRAGSPAATGEGALIVIDESGDQATASILVVCTANVCRSPLAARVLHRALAGADVLGSASIGSAGTLADDESEMCAVSASLLESADGAPEHRSRPLTPDLVRAADLVLTMEREQRSLATRAAPGSQAKVFTLKEALALARTAAGRGVTRPITSVADVARALHAVRGYAVVVPEKPRRGLFGRRSAEPVDPLTIPDGHGDPDPKHRAALRDVRTTTEELATALRALVEAAPADPTAPADSAPVEPAEREGPWRG